MKLVEYTDDTGRKHLAYIKDNEPVEKASTGIKSDPPDIEELDWYSIKLEIHNRLISQRILTWEDVQKNQNSLTSIITSVVKKYLIAKYRE